MSKNYALQAEEREGAGKGVARALRREHKIPAVIYGDKKAPVNITLPAKEANVEYNKGHMFTTLCDLKIGSDKHLVLARDIQVHPVTDVVQHIDFLRVSAKTKIHVAVPVHFSGYEGSPAEKGGGVLNITRHEVELACQATAIPDDLHVDVSGVEIGDSVKSSAITLPDGAKFVIDDRDFTIATVIAPRAVIEEAPAEGEEGAEGEAAAEGEGGEEAKAEGDGEAKAEE